MNRIFENVLREAYDYSDIDISSMKKVRTFDQLEDLVDSGLIVYGTELGGFGDTVGKVLAVNDESEVIWGDEIDDDDKEYILSTNFVVFDRPVSQEGSNVISEDFMDIDDMNLYY